jgi:hypothetical protein
MVCGRSRFRLGLSHKAAEDAASFLWYVGIEAIDQPAGSLGPAEWQIAA